MRVQLAVPWTDGDGSEHRAGTKVQVSQDVGRQLILDGHAAAAGAVDNDPPNDPGAPTYPANEPASTRSPATGTTEKGAGHGGTQL